MNLTKRNKIVAGVLVLAAGAFVVDWMTSGGGATEVQAASMVNESEPVVAAPRTESRTAKSMILPAATSQKSLAARLQEAAEANDLTDKEIPDAFRLPAAWSPPKQSAVVSGVTEFNAKYKLNAVMKGRSGTGGLAIINGKMYRAGDMVEGFQLLAVKEQSALLRSSTGEVELRLEVR